MSGAQSVYGLMEGSWLSLLVVFLVAGGAGVAFLYIFKSAVEMG